MSHTPGPWEAWASEDGALEIYGKHSDRTLVVCSRNAHPSLADEMQANARLIGAAPELLEALQELVARCDGQDGVRADGSNIQTMKAHAAIAKAEGK